MQREKFSSRLGFILVSAGCAVGLGNVWKFPYMCGQYGGAAFILIYLIFLVILGLPIIVCEFAVGRGSQKSVASSFTTLCPSNKRWGRAGYLCMAGNYLLMMFYTMVSGWMLYYFKLSLTGAFTSAAMSTDEVSAIFTGMLGAPGIMTLCMVISVLLSFGVCALGVQKGVEKITKIMMLCLLALIVVLAVHSITLPGASKGIRFYLVPDFAAMKEQGIATVIFGAMSQAFFTLSLGIGSMAIFGSYLGKDRSLGGEAINITLLDTFVAIMAGLIIIPACFSFGIEPGSGPSLIFITLPNIFNQMAGGRIWGTLFFLFLSFAALSTVIAVFENIVSFGIDLWSWSRKKSVAINIAAIILLSMPCILGFNVLSGIQPLGEGSNIMDLEDFLVSSNILPIGAMIYIFFCTAKSGWGWDNFIKEVNSGKGHRFPASIRRYMTYVIPVIITVIYLKGYYDLFSPKGLSYLIPWMIVAILMLIFCFSMRVEKKK